MQLQGWLRDPYGNHDERWFSAGTPTSLVRDQGVESYDEPPRDGLPVHPPSPAGEQLALDWAGWQGRPREWRSWTVLLPGALAIGPWSLLLAFRDSVGVPEFVLGIALVAQGLRFPASRKGIAVVLWLAFALTCFSFVMLVFALASAIGNMS